MTTETIKWCGIAIDGPLKGQFLDSRSVKIVIPVKTGPDRGEGDRGFSMGAYVWSPDGWTYDGPEPVIIDEVSLAEQLIRLAERPRSYRVMCPPLAPEREPGAPEPARPAQMTKSSPLAIAIANLKAAARAAGLTDEEIDSELANYNAERRASC